MSEGKFQGTRHLAALRRSNVHPIVRLPVCRLFGSNCYFVPVHAKSPNAHRQTGSLTSSR